MQEKIGGLDPYQRSNAIAVVDRSDIKPNLRESLVGIQEANGYIDLKGAPSIVDSFYDRPVGSRNVNEAIERVKGVNYGIYSLLKKPDQKAELSPTIETALIHSLYYIALNRQSRIEGSDISNTIILDKNLIQYIPLCFSLEQWKLYLGNFGLTVGKITTQDGEKILMYKYVNEVDKTTRESKPVKKTRMFNTEAEFLNFCKEDFDERVKKDKLYNFQISFDNLVYRTENHTIDGEVKSVGEFIGGLSVIYQNLALSEIADGKVVYPKSTIALDICRVPKYLFYNRIVDRFRSFLDIEELQNHHLYNALEMCDSSAQDTLTFIKDYSDAELLFNQIRALVRSKDGMIIIPFNRDDITARGSRVKEFYNIHFGDAEDVDGAFTQGNLTIIFNEDEKQIEISYNPLISSDANPNPFKPIIISLGEKTKMDDVAKILKNLELSVSIFSDNSVNKDPRIEEPRIRQLVTDSVKNIFSDLIAVNEALVNQGLYSLCRGIISESDSKNRNHRYLSLHYPVYIDLTVKIKTMLAAIGFTNENSLNDFIYPVLIASLEGRSNAIATKLELIPDRTTKIIAESIAAATSYSLPGIFEIAYKEDPFVLYSALMESAAAWFNLDIRKITKDADSNDVEALHLQVVRYLYSLATFYSTNHSETEVREEPILLGEVNVSNLNQSGSEIVLTEKVTEASNLRSSNSKWINRAKAYKEA